MSRGPLIKIRDKILDKQLYDSWKFPDMGPNEEIVWMTPKKFLKQCPHPQSEKINSTYALAEYDEGRDYPQGFNPTSIDYILKTYKNKEPIGILYLDYGDIYYGWPSHEGRHRALCAHIIGLKEVPVFVRRK